MGEEVNSIRDRRSNEILATVAMRAMDNTAKAPTQVIITALDSRSFAEYLNENSDILQAVLSKNNAMGRKMCIRDRASIRKARRAVRKQN